jgi:hypothetical protein
VCIYFACFRVAMKIWLFVTEFIVLGSATGAGSSTLYGAHIVAMRGHVHGRVHVRGHVHVRAYAHQPWRRPGY